MDLSLYKNRRVAGEYNISESGSTDDISLDDDYFEVNNYLWFLDPIWKSPF